jgi:hypothetical protein
MDIAELEPEELEEEDPAVIAYIVIAPLEIEDEDHEDALLFFPVVKGEGFSVLTLNFKD